MADKKFTDEEWAVLSCGHIKNAIEHTPQWHREFEKNYDIFHEHVVKGSTAPTVDELIVNSWRKLSKQQKYDILAVADNYNRSSFRRDKLKIMDIRLIVLKRKEK